MKALIVRKDESTGYHYNQGITYHIQNEEGGISFSGSVEVSYPSNNPYANQVAEVSGASFRLSDPDAVRMMALNLLRAADELEKVNAVFTKGSIDN